MPIEGKFLEIVPQRGKREEYFYPLTKRSGPWVENGSRDFTRWQADPGGPK